MAAVDSFTCEVKESPTKDERGNHLTTVICHGRLVFETAAQFKSVVHPLILLGGRIVVNLGDVTQVDSSGLGTMVGLKVSAIRQGSSILEFTNLTPRVLELLRLTNLTQLFSS